MFNNLRITNAGMSLISAGVSGDEIEFTSIKLGDGTAPSDPLTLTDLVSVKQTLAIYNLRRFDTNKVLVGSVLQGSQVVQGFSWKEIGVFAKNKTTNGQPVLFAYDNAGENASYIPAGGTVIEKVINVTLIMSNVANVTATINNALVYLLKNNPDFVGQMKSGDKNVLLVDSRVKVGDTTFPLELDSSEDIKAKIGNKEYKVLTTKEFIVSATQPTAEAGVTKVWFEDVQ